MIKRREKKENGKGKFGDFFEESELGNIKINCR